MTYPLRGSDFQDQQNLFLFYVYGNRFWNHFITYLKLYSLFILTRKNATESIEKMRQEYDKIIDNARKLCETWSIPFKFDSMVSLLVAFVTSYVLTLFP
ncbi:zinc finger MYM-type protein 1-like [Aphis craccivora]|uniref:Zinc finger MYM-type protein 1-like n=1 Tax=Aphis craccivora TaxID=307492 RepID=A0A6G0VHY0_APHCR|nr:zinc finger MYM-type protein 1-like [Aphis craccivora]